MATWPTIVTIGGLASLIHLIVFLVILLRRNKDLDQKLALLYGGISLLWIIAATLASMLGRLPDIVAVPADLLLPVLATALAVGELLLICSLLEWPLVSVVATAGGTWTVMLLVGNLYFLFFPPPLVPLLQIAQGGWSLLILIVTGLIVATFYRSRLALYRNRTLYWLLAALPLSAGQAMSLLPAGPLRMIGPLLHIFGIVALARGVASYWLPNVKAMMWAILRFLLLFALTASLIFGIIMGTERLALRLPFSNTILIIALACVAALLYLPLYQLIQRLVNRLVERMGFDPAQALRDYSQTIGTVLDLEQLAQIAAQTVAQVFDVRKGALLVTTGSERGGLHLQPVPGMGEVPREPLELEPISPILARIRERDEPLFQYEIEHNPDLRAAAKRELDWLHNLGMEVYLPIRSQGELTGLLALGPQRTGEIYSPRSLEFLTTLAHQTGVALQNASLFEGLRALNVHVTELNENLRAAYERLERLDRAKTDFLSIASHELRTPLTQMRGYVDILTELSETDALSPNQIVHIASSISRPVRRLESIINAMLDASQIETEGLSLHFAPTTLASIVRTAIEGWVPALQERRLVLTTTGLDNIPPITADAQRLFQAFSNLISNAIKFTPDGGSIAIEAHPLDREHFEITFSDTGIGISAPDQELIFEKFYRVGSVSLHSSGEYKFKGAGPGLGLPIARGVIEGHGGCIWVESEGYDEERCPGSTFHVVLPYKAHRGPCRYERRKGTPAPSDLSFAELPTDL